MSRKREMPHLSRVVPYSYPKRRRPPPHQVAVDDQRKDSSSKSQATVAVIGLSPDYSVLDLKAKFEIYGSIARTRMDPNNSGLAYITFRSKESADSAIAASLDLSFGITLDSKRVQVRRASDPVPGWMEGVATKRSSSATVSKLSGAEVPLSKHGRRNKLGSAIVNPRDNSDDNGSSTFDEPFRGREIIAYDDIL